MEWCEQLLQKCFVGLEQGFCKDFVKCLMKDGKAKVALKYNYFNLQKSHKWRKRKNLKFLWKVSEGKVVVLVI